MSEMGGELCHSARRHCMSCSCSEWADTPSPVQALLPSNGPGEPLVLWAGNVRGHASDGNTVLAPARVTLSWRRRSDLRWALDESAMTHADRAEWSRCFHRSKALDIEFAGQWTQLDASLSQEFGGTINGGELGSPSAPLKYVITHWVGLPTFPFANQVPAHDRDPWPTWQGPTEVSMP